MLRHALMSRVLIGAALINVFGILPAHADACADKKVAFDGIQPLEYRRVAGDAGRKAFIVNHADAVCLSTDGATCKAPFVIPGDIVAVGKTCGGLAYVQYLGNKVVTTGWMQAKSLEAWHPTNLDEKPTVYGSPDAAVGHERFKLIQGNGIPVCNAYLQRLNSTYFGAPAFCGRPENASVPGFDRLSRVYLTTREVNDIFDTGIAERFRMSIWRYDPPIDADNDGSPDNVLIWNLDDPLEPHCGIDSGGPGGEDTGFQMALILAPDNKSVDLRKTKEIFGNDDPNTAEKINIMSTSSAKSFLYEFPAYGQSYNLFRYRGVTYFDTYVRNRHEQRFLMLEPSKLRVFLHRDQHTGAVCTLRTY